MSETKLILKPQGDLLMRLLVAIKAIQFVFTEGKHKQQIHSFCFILVTVTK